MGENSEGNLREHKVLKYLRENVTLDRIKEVEKRLEGKYGQDLNKYFDETLMESVYRGHKGSYKIGYSKSRGMEYLAYILFLLFNEVVESEEEARKAIRKHFKKDSYFGRYAIRFLDMKTGDEKAGWIDVEPYVYEILGGEIFFYCTLKALLEVSKKALTDPEYDYIVMNWKEGVVEYLVGELCFSSVS